MESFIGVSLGGLKSRNSLDKNDRFINNTTLYLVKHINFNKNRKKFWSGSNGMGKNEEVGVERRSFIWECCCDLCVGERVTSPWLVWVWPVGVDVARWPPMTPWSCAAAVVMATGGSGGEVAHLSQGFPFTSTHRGNSWLGEFVCVCLCVFMCAFVRLCVVDMLVMYKPWGCMHMRFDCNLCDGKSIVSRLWMEYDENF